MEYRKLGRSGLKVSEIALGSWLTYGGSTDESHRARVHPSRLRAGGQPLRHRRRLPRGRRRRRCSGGRWRSCRAARLVIASKAFFPVGEGPNDRGLSRKHLMEQCHASLRRLRTDYLDLYQCHRFDPETPLEETLRALDDLVTQGKVLYVGVSQWSAAQIAEALGIQRRLGLDPIVSNQPQYSLLWRDPEAEVLPLSVREGVGQIVFSPLAQGVLTGKYRPGEPAPAGSRATDESSNQFMGKFLRDEVLRGVERLRPIAAELELSLAQLALAWVLSQPGIASAIVGASRPEQVEENAAAAGVRLDAETRARIEEAVSGKGRR